MSIDRTVLFAFFAALLWSNAALASGPGCGFYTRVERACACGAEGYALGYGRKYCRRFATLSGLSAQGRRWRDATIACLQDRLGEALPDDPAGCDCRALKRAGYRSHFGCYVGGKVSACDLPPADLALIHQAIDRADRTDARGLRLILKLADKCIAENPANAGGAAKAIRRARTRK